MLIYCTMNNEQWVDTLIMSNIVQPIMRPHNSVAVTFRVYTISGQPQKTAQREHDLSQALTLPHHPQESCHILQVGNRSASGSG